MAEIIDLRAQFNRRFWQNSRIRWSAEEQSRIYPQVQRMVDRLTAKHDIGDVALVLRSYGANLVDEVKRNRGE